MFVATRWDCPNCATKDIDADKCPYCGTSRDGHAPPSAPVQALVVAAPQPPKYRLTPDHDLFILTKQNAKFVHGKSSHVGDRYIVYLIICTLVTVLVGSIIFLYLADQWGTVLQLNQSGVATHASIVSRRISRGSKSSSYYLTYQFYVKDTPFTHEQTVSSGTYDRFPPESKVTVRYLPDNPKVSILAGDSEDNSNLIGSTVVFLLIVAMLVAFTYYNANKTQHYRRLNRAGTLLQGEIVSATGARAGKSGYQVTVNYSFVTPNGQLIQKTTKQIRNDLAKQRLPRIGTPVAVLYVDDNHFEMM